MASHQCYVLTLFAMFCVRYCSCQQNRISIQIVFVPKGPSTYDILFFGPFLTYPPTHIRSYQILKKWPKVGYQIFENWPTQIHDMYLILLSINRAFGQTLLIGLLTNIIKLLLTYCTLPCNWFYLLYVGHEHLNYYLHSHQCPKFCVFVFPCVILHEFSPVYNFILFRHPGGTRQCPRSRHFLVMIDGESNL